MLKLLLVNTNLEKAPYPVPPLGLCLLAAVLKDRHEVRIYDGVFDEGRGLGVLVEDFRPDVIGFSIRNIDDVVMDREIFYMDDIMEKFILPVKRIADVPVILGGSGFSIFPSELMEMTGADFGIAGEAESILPMLLDRMESGLDTAGIPNLYSAQGFVTGNGTKLVTTGLAGAKFSEIDRWIDFTPYRSKGVYSIQTKRGCSHGCIYCTYPLIEGKRFRTRNPGEIADEIREARDRLGYITFEFVDSTFNDPPGHAEALCREIINRKLNVKLRTMGINPRHVSDELFDLMLRAGFVQIDATTDSASPRVLESLNKGFTLAEIRRMAALIRKFDIPTMWFFLFGGPGEDIDTFRETLDFIDGHISKADLVYMNAGLRIYPGTPLQRIAESEGLVNPGQSLFRPPVYYYSHSITKDYLDLMIRDAAAKRHNCIPALETAPSPAMIAEAVEMRKLKNLDEPMFRTLLRIRATWRAAGKI